VVISGQCLEHVRNPFRLVAEMARMLKPAGWIFLTAPTSWELHRCPLDYWRILPDGMDALFQ
jgi:2-polyprenyl-3-methyl-5-hydroxy-6-metoxy-1,4-benzoquinol methylase